MAIGDAADAAGMVVLAGTEDLRDSYIEHNRTRDYIADHQESGTHPASAINSGTIAAARLPALSAMSGIAPKARGLDAEGMLLSPDTISGQWTASAHLGVVGAFAAGGKVTCVDSYSRAVTGLGGYRAMYVAADGTYGWVPSSIQFKQDVVAAVIPRAQLRAFRVVFYRYIADVAAGHEEPQLGAIAEEVHELGLTWLVDYKDGAPFGLRERAMPFIAMLLAQDAEDRIDELTRTVYDHHADFLALRDEVRALTGGSGE